MTKSAKDTKNSKNSKNAKDSKNSKKDGKNVKSYSKADSKKVSKDKDETSPENEEEQTPASIYAAVITRIDDTLGTLKDEFKLLKGLGKKLGKRTRKPGTISPNNAFTRQMEIPAPLIPLLRNPIDNKKLNKKSTLSRTQLVKAINNYCKKADLGQGGGFYKPDEPLREALLMKKKETFKSSSLQTIISKIYKHYDIKHIPIDGDATTDSSSKKSKRQLAEDDTESDKIRSEESEKPKNRKRSNA